MMAEPVAVYGRHPAGLCVGITPLFAQLFGSALEVKFKTLNIQFFIFKINLKYIFL